MESEHPDFDLFNGETDEEAIWLLAFAGARDDSSALITVPVHNDQEEIVHWIGRDNVGKDAGIQCLCHTAKPWLGEDRDAR